MEGGRRRCRSGRMRTAERRRGMPFLKGLGKHRQSSRTASNTVCLDGYISISNIYYSILTVWVEDSNSTARYFSSFFFWSFFESCLISILVNTYAPWRSHRQG